MDRLAWLEAQDWIAPCASPPQECGQLRWCFFGMACFVALDAGSSNAAGASYIFFSGSKDPSQMAVKVGIVMQTAALPKSVLLCFDESPAFVLDLSQVRNVIVWEKSQGCKLCKETISSECGCQRLPNFLTLHFRHVAVKIYNHAVPNVQSCSIARLSEQLLAALKMTEAPDPPKGSLEAEVCLEDLLAATQTQMQQFTKACESMCSSALAASEFCSANADLTGKLLLSVAQSSKEISNMKSQASNLLTSLLIYLKDCQSEEQLLINRKGSTSVQELKLAKEKIAKITNAILDLEIIRA